jgi:hypothetical protein
MRRDEATRPQCLNALGNCVPSDGGKFLSAAGRLLQCERNRRRPLLGAGPAAIQQCLRLFDPFAWR